MSKELGASLGDIIKVVGIIIGLLASVYWYRRNKLDKELGLLLAAVEKMEEKGCRYWSIDPSNADSVAIASEIKRLSKRIGNDISHLNRSFRRFKFVEYNNLTSFRQSIMSDTFEQTDRELEPRRVENITDRCADLVKSIHRSRNWL